MGTPVVVAGGGSPTTGPSLEKYVEIRLNLLIESINDTNKASDLRYQERFVAQTKALDAAFLSQQQAVQAALAAADRAVAKAETAADKRFEALNELRQMLNDMVATLLTRNEATAKFDSIGEKMATRDERLSAIELRLNSLAAGGDGGRGAKADMRANLAALVGLVALGVVLWRVMTGH